MPAVELLRERLVETAEGREKNTGGTDVKYEWMDNYLMKKAGVTRDLQEDWNWIRYQIDGKMFAAICMDENDRPYYLTMKLQPLEGDFWRGQYEDVIPGYYMNKTHWNSIRADGAVPDDIVKDKAFWKTLVGDEVEGANIVVKSLPIIMKTIIDNCGESSDVIMNKVRSNRNKENIGFNAKTKQIENLVDGGVLDSSKVLRVSLENSISTASMILLIDCTIIDEEEEKK